jgi:ketosteroid isomerase-like protein
VTSPGDTVRQLFASFGDRGAARALWHDDAVWHLTGRHADAGDLDPDAYLDLLERWRREHPDYLPQVIEVREYDDDVAVVHLRSIGGSAPGTAAGLMVYRVVDGRVAEGWAIASVGHGEHPF